MRQCSSMFNLRNFIYRLNLVNYGYFTLKTAPTSECCNFYVCVCSFKIKWHVMCKKRASCNLNFTLFKWIIIVQWIYFFVPTLLPERIFISVQS